MEHCEVFPVPDAAWADYQRHQDKEDLAGKHAGFFRATFMPTLASALAPDRGTERLRAFVDRLEDGLKGRLANYPAPLDLFVQTIVLAKQGEAQSTSRIMSRDPASHERENRGRTA